MAAVDGSVVGMGGPWYSGCATVEQLRDTGLAIVLLPTTSFQASLNAIDQVLREVAADGHARKYCEANPDAFPGAGVYEALEVGRYIDMDSRTRVAAATAEGEK
ncbi:hypothetical protein [Salinibacterium sp. ZJ70]|uniref:hypothetical protein n=1 Tax=Salinibacterium sp. ZJ70 TaxID=2708084 RepID=UPI00141DEEDA|nr:hypothetical protein [Salinibacterium sp. ZJ70]